MESIRYKKRNGQFISFASDMPKRMTKAKLVKTYGDKVVDIEDLAKVLGYTKSKSKAKEEE